MERLSVLCLLLLCSLLGAELLDNEITEQRAASPERATVEEQPQHCPPDLNALLRDMSVQLAENRLLIQQLQTLNQEQAAKLAKNEAGIQELHNLNQEQAAKLAKNEAGILELHNLNQAQGAELRSLKTWANVTENQVVSLRRNREVAQVAFSASLLASGSGYIGPINAHTTLVFKHVVSNIGNAYNPNTGFFTAPVRGAYHFEFYFLSGGGSIPSAVALVNNGKLIFTANERQDSGNASASNGATLLLEAGDVVFLRLSENTRIYDNQNHFSTFSGHLLFPM